MQRAALWMAFLALGAAAGRAPNQPGGSPVVVAVKAGRVMDVRSGKYLDRQIIWIEGNRIKQIGSTAELAPRLPAGARVIDLSRETVLPGLIDCHTHLTFSPYTLGFRLKYPALRAWSPNSAAIHCWEAEIGETTSPVGAAGTLLVAEGFLA